MLWEEIHDGERGEEREEQEDTEVHAEDDVAACYCLSRALDVDCE